MEFLTRTVSIAQRSNPRQEALTVYRHLLREVGQFFDPNAQNFMRQHIRLRYERHRHVEFPDFARKKIKAARRIHSMIRRANWGHDKYISTILAHTYGRRGPIRSALLRALLRYQKGNLRGLPDDGNIKTPIRAYYYRRKQFRTHLDNVFPPLPAATTQMLEDRAQFGTHSVVQEWLKLHEARVQRRGVADHLSPRERFWSGRSSASPVPISTTKFHVPSSPEDATRITRHIKRRQRDLLRWGRRRPHLPKSGIASVISSTEPTTSTEPIHPSAGTFHHPSVPRFLTHLRYPSDNRIRRFYQKLLRQVPIITVFPFKIDPTSYPLMNGYNPAKAMWFVYPASQPSFATLTYQLQIKMVQQLERGRRQRLGLAETDPLPASHETILRLPGMSDLPPAPIDPWSPLARAGQTNGSSKAETASAVGPVLKPLTQGDYYIAITHSRWAFSKPISSLNDFDTVGLD
ncbi:hypothetical protein H4R33_002753 [Dimargaris cristalligena]|nr:hypothetical protein H4R33_002753 [Dimargaris cristalligena]